jgi:hypothetical protein
MDHEDRARCLRVAITALSSVVVLAGAACGQRAAAGPVSGGSPPGAAAGGSTPTTPRDIPSPTGTHPSSTASGSAVGVAFTTADLETYAYALTDETRLAAEAEETATTLGQLESDAQSRNVGAVEADASDLLSLARTMEGDAGDATARLKPLGPEDADLKEIRTDALDAFGLTEDYAGTVVDLAEAATSVNLQEMVSVLQQAASLAGTSTQLTASYSSLSVELVAWSQANAAGAAKALGLYGS